MCASAVTQSGDSAHWALRSLQDLCKWSSTAHNAFCKTLHSFIHSLFICWARWDKENAESVIRAGAVAPLIFSCSLNNDTRIMTAKAKLFSENTDTSLCSTSLFLFQFVFTCHSFFFSIHRKHSRCLLASKQCGNNTACALLANTLLSSAWIIVTVHINREQNSNSHNGSVFCPFFVVVDFIVGIIKWRNYSANKLLMYSSRVNIEA